MQTQHEIEEAIELMQLCSNGSLTPKQKFPPKVKHHMQGVIQGLQWALDHNNPAAQSLKDLLAQARIARQASGEMVHFAE